MPDRDAFLNTIAASPADDGPRLVYADWLEEQGDADRAEFIRLQIDLARTEDDDDPPRPAKQRRVEALLTAHWRDWLTPVVEALGDPPPRRPGDPQPPPTRRGFADRLVQRVLGAIIPGPPPPRPDDYELSGTTVTLNRTGPTSMSQRNFRAATFTRGFPDTVELFAWPELDRDVVRRLASRCPLAHLHLRGPLDNWDQLDGPHFHALSSLTVNPMGPVGGSMAAVLRRLFAALGESPHLGGLTMVGTDTLLDEGTVAAFARTPLLARLKHLIFAVGTGTMLALADHAEYGRLDRLGLIVYSATVGAFCRLLDSPAAVGLRDLALVVEDEDDASLIVAALAASPRAQPLQTLIFDSSAVSDRLVSTLVGSSTFASLTRLGLPRDIVVCHLSRAGITALATSTGLAALRELDLTGHGLYGSALDPLFTATGLPSLRNLELRENNVGDDGAAALAAGPLAPQLRRLDLGFNHIGSSGAVALARAAGLDGLHHLTLTGNDVGPVGRSALLDRFGDRVVF
jgi:uncharacterized protein (TIGR02996 family)